MSIFLDRSSKVIVQGITGRMAQFHTKEMIDYGTNVVAGVVPGKAGETVHGVPVFDTVKQAVEATGADTSLVVRAAALCRRQHHGGCRWGHPLLRLHHRWHPGAGYDPGETLYDALSPRTPHGADRAELRGHHRPGKALLGIMPGHIYLQGNVGIVGRSGTLGYEAAQQLKDRGIGISTSVGIGGDPINGSSFRDILEQFENDPDTHVIALIGEIGGPQEAEAAAYIQNHMTKPVVAYIAGLTAPKGRTMGHAGAIISAFGESASEKVEILTAAGVTVAENPSVIGETIARVMQLQPA